MQQVMGDGSSHPPVQSTTSPLEKLVLNSTWTGQDPSDRKRATIFSLGASGGVLGGVVSASVGLWTTGATRVLWSVLGVSAAAAGAAAAITLNGLQRRLPSRHGSDRDRVAGYEASRLVSRTNWATIGVPLGLFLGIGLLLVNQKVRSAQAAADSARHGEKLALDSATVARQASAVAEKSRVDDVTHLLRVYESTTPEVSAPRVLGARRSFVFLGICSDHWVNPNFRDLPMCADGPLTSPVVITATRGMKARAVATSERGIGKELARIKPGEAILLRGMKEISPPSDSALRIYWGEVELSETGRSEKSVSP